jgi:hypothetical protein
MAEDPRLTNILKIIFGGGQPAEQDNSVAAGNSAMSGGGDAVPAPIIKNAIPPPIPNTPVAPEHTNILKMLFGGGLTRSGVDYGDAAPPSDQPGMVSGGQPGSNQRYFNDPSQAGVALAQAMRPAAQVQTSDISGPISAPGPVHATGEDYVTPPAGGVGPPQDPNTQLGYDPSADPTPTFNPAPSVGLLPHIFRPSFRQAATDEAGNIRSNSPGLTKGGVLLKILGGGLQGLADAAAGGALDALRDGSSPFGTGVQAAMTMPWLRARRYQALQQQGQENQIRQDEISSLPARRAQRNAQASATLAGTRASTALHQAQTTDALRGPKAPKDSLQDQRQSFADEHADIFQDKNERKNFILYGTQPKAATKNPTEWSLRVDAANGDEDAQAVLDQRNRDQRALAGIRHAGNSKQAAAEDAASAEEIAAKIMNSSNGDPDKALTQFDQLSPNVTDPQQRRLGPLIRRALRGRKRINPVPKPQSELDKLLAQP